MPSPSPLTSPSIGIIAASSAVPWIELASGAALLRREGFSVDIHPHCHRRHFTFAGTDAERASALWEYATDSRLGVLWCACGGYGASRLLPLLDEWTVRHGPPPRKLLAGYSDVTSLHQFVHRRWGWATLHAPMPTTFDSLVQDPPTWQSLLASVRGQCPPQPWGIRPLRFLTDPPPAPIDAELIGGNLTLWSSLTGTRHGPAPATGQIVFFEEVGEELYRIDRQVTQLDQAGLLDGTVGIILGDFTNCNDTVRVVRSSASDPAAKAPLRPTYTLDSGLHEIFAPLARRLNIPLARGLPVGHGPHFAPLPLHARYRIGIDGAFELLRWDRE